MRWSEAELHRHIAGLRMPAAEIPQKKPSKYRNKKVRADGYTFDSKAEHKRYEQLVLLERAKLITELGIHVRFPIVVNGQKVCVYESDFVYFDAGGKQIVEDVKGVRTALYQLKKKLMRAALGIEISEIG